MTGPQGMGTLSPPERLSDYDALLLTLGPIFFLRPVPTMPTYTAWESRSTAYANDISLESQKGFLYFRAWMADSGNVGTYDDHLNDTEIGTIFKVEETLT